MALETEIRAYEARKPELERHHLGKWVVFHDDELVGAFDTLDWAASEAALRFGRGPYLIKQVGAPPVTLPASVFYQPVGDIADR